MTKICSTCQAENRDDDASCRVCGAPFDEGPKPANGATRIGTACPECGYLNEGGVRFCAKCGGGLATGATSTTSVTGTTGITGTTAAEPRAAALRGARIDGIPPRASEEPPIDIAASLPLPASLSPAAASAAASASASTSAMPGPPAVLQDTVASSPSAAQGAADPPQHEHGATTYPPLFEGLPPPDVPDPEAALEAGRTHANGWADTSVGFGEPAGPPPVDRRSLWAGLGIAVVVAALMAWWFLDGAPPPSEAAPAAAVAAAPASSSGALDATAASAPVSATAATPLPENAAATAAVAGGTSATETTASDSSAQPTPSSSTPSTSSSTSSMAANGGDASSTSSASTAPPATASSPSTTAAAAATAPPASTASRNARARVPTISEAESQRLAAARKARDKAEREAKVKAAIEQREQAVARLRDQESARRRAEEQARVAVVPRANPTPTAAAAPLTPVRSVKEICAGRNPISQAVCESRECGNAEHAGEPGCRAIRASEERRRDNLDR
jgi:S-DNA-T family DNA segregation ATPase FtsK/SpoIIIE